MYQKIKKYYCFVNKIIKFSEHNKFIQMETSIGKVKGKIKFDIEKPEDIIGKKLDINGKKITENNEEFILFYNAKIVRDKVGTEKQLVCKIKNVLYEDKEEMFYIFNTNEGVIKGNIPFHFNDLKDVEVKLEGEWKKEKGNVFFQFNCIEQLQSDLYFFLTKIVKGIGPKLAQKLLNDFTEEQLKDILENTPEELLKVKGLKEKKLKKIKTHWDEYQHLSELAFMLRDYGIRTVIRIYNHFGNNSVNICKENPYRLAEIKAIGFKIADKISHQFEIDKDSIFRVSAGIIYTIEKIMDDKGHSYVNKDELFALASEELNKEEVFTLERDLFDGSIDNLIDENKISFIDEEEMLIARTNYIKMENYILDFLNQRKDLKSGKILSDINSHIEEYEKNMNMKFSDEQKEAIKIANEGYMIIGLSGYAGTGKSTISKAIIELLCKKYDKDKIVCTALSGMAANRINKTTGYPSLTIHSLLGYKKDGFEYNETNKLPYDIILIDEASMVNTYMFSKLFEAISENTVVMLVGDPAQLPPIGAGNVFSDIIKNKIVKGAELTKIYRQSEDAVITYFASFIRKGEVPEGIKNEYDDFSFKSYNVPHSIKQLPEKEQKAEKEKNQMIILSKIKDVYEKNKKDILSLYKPTEIKNYLNYFQIITAMKKGILGTDYLNKSIQNILNSKPEGYPKVNLYNGNEIRIKDKILHKINANMLCQSTEDYKKEPFSGKNSEEKKVYNGQIGVVFAIDQEMEEVHIYYPNEGYVTNYSYNQAKEFLDLSYALTIHKTQGSEFTNVVMPIVNAHYIMLNNQLLYTAITRAKDNIKIFGHNYAFKKACTTVDSSERNTIINFKVLKEKEISS